MFIFKIIISLIAISLMNNPLTNTHWQTGDGLSMHFNSTDTVSVFAGDENQLISKGIFSVKDSVLTWRDMETEMGACDTSVVGTYIFTINKDHLSFRLISDECTDRSKVIQKLELVRVTTLQQFPKDL